MSSDVHYIFFHVAQDDYDPMHYILVFKIELTRFDTSTDTHSSAKLYKKTGSTWEPIPPVYFDYWKDFKALNVKHGY